MTAVTFADALGKHHISLPDPDLADLEVPVITGEPQAQGDVAIFPVADVGRARFSATELTRFMKVGPHGVQVVRGENGGNTHILDAYHGDVYYLPFDAAPGSVTLGHLHVCAAACTMHGAGDAAVAYLTHTDEHGSNGIGPGDYVVNGKQEQRDIVARVAD